MTTIYDIFNFIDSFAPFESQMDFDNSGLLVGDFSKKSRKVSYLLGYYQK